MQSQRFASGLFILVTFCLMSLVASVSIPRQTNSSILPARALVQFSSQGHILGFGRDEIFAANGGYSLHVEFVGANLSTPTTVNFTKATNRAAPPLHQVIYPNLWDGITLTYDAPTQGILRSTYTLMPGARAEAIRLRYNLPLTVRSDGGLSLAFAKGTLSESAPVAWQVIDGQRVPVAVAFESRGERQVGFALGEHDPNISLTIDPILTWNTFLGGSEIDFGTAIDVDENGNVYIAGSSRGTWGNPVHSYGSRNEIFVAKLDPNGALLWNTFLGGKRSDIPGAISADALGNVFVTGTSSSTWGVPIRAHTRHYDAFAAKLDPSGTLVWNTFLGGSKDDGSSGIVIDTRGNLIVSGDSGASWGTPIRAYEGGYSDGFVAKLNPDGTLNWSTFLGGNSQDDSGGITLDGDENAYLTGSSSSTWGDPIHPYTTSTQDAFVAKLNSGGTLIWNTFLGESGCDGGSDIALDGNGNLFITGSSDARSGVSQPGACNATIDAVAAKFTLDGELLWNIYFGDGRESGAGIAVDDGGNVLVSGNSYTSWGTPIRPYTSNRDGFTAKFDSNGMMIWNTFLGGSGFDLLRQMALDESGSIYVVGSSQVSWGTPIRRVRRGLDAFVAKIPAVPACDQIPDKPSLLTPNESFPARGPSVKLDWSDTACATMYKVIVRQDPPNGALIFKKRKSKSQASTTPLVEGEKYYWRVVARNSFGKSRTLWSGFTVVNSP